MIVANIGLIISSGGMVLLPLLSGKMVDAIRAGEDLVPGAIQFLILTVFMAVFSAVRGYSFMLLGERVMVCMRQ
jgi:ABC-type multidrug transport system fused ATPase/permease subunit